MKKEVTLTFDIEQFRECNMLDMKPYHSLRVGGGGFRPLVGLMVVYEQYININIHIFRYKYTNWKILLCMPGTPVMRNTTCRWNKKSVGLK